MVHLQLSFQSGAGLDLRSKAISGMEIILCHTNVRVYVRALFLQSNYPRRACAARVQ